MSFLSVLIPIYNEEENIVPYLKGHRKSVRQSVRLTKSSLSTRAVKTTLSKSFPNFIKRHRVHELSNLKSTLDKSIRDVWKVYLIRQCQGNKKLYRQNISGH